MPTKHKYRPVLRTGSSSCELAVNVKAFLQDMNQEQVSDIECDQEEDQKQASQGTPEMADATMDSENELDPSQRQPQEVNLQIQDEQQSQPLIKTPPPDLQDETEEELRRIQEQDVGCCEKCCSPCMPCINRLDKLDKKLSGYIFKSSPGKVMDVIIAIGCLAFSYFGFPLWIVLYVVIYESYLYALCVLVSIVVTQVFFAFFAFSHFHQCDVMLSKMVNDLIDYNLIIAIL